MFSGDGLAPMQFGVLLASLLHHVHPCSRSRSKHPGVPLAIDLTVAEGHLPVH